MEPSQKTIEMVFGFPRKGEVYGTFDVLDSTFDPSTQTWSVTFAEEVQKKYAIEALRTFIGRQAIFAIEDIDYSVEFPKSGLVVETVRDNPPGAVQTRVSGSYTTNGALQNPMSVADFNADMDKMTVSNPKKHFRVYPAGELHSKKFRDQLFKFVTRRGESYGWVANGEIYHRKGSLIMPYVKINKHIEKSVVSYHTHPSKDEPSLTSPDDIQWYMDAAYSEWGIRHFYTIMKDRLDHFEFIIKGDEGRKRYLKMNEGKFVDDLGTMLDKAEKEYKDKEELDDYQFCERVTRAWIKDINSKFSHLVEIKYHHHIRPGAPKKKKVLANPGSGNPFPHTSRIKVDDKYLSIALNELKGIDYDWIHYGGDEFSHTMYVYWWLKYHFLPKADDTDRLWLWEKKGMDEETRSKIRKYLQQEVEDGWTNADCLLMIGLFHDIAKKREKEQKIHHSILGADMFKEEIAPELKLPTNLTERLYLMLQSDVGRKRITEEQFQTIAGDLYPVAKMFHMADRTAHHPYMYTIAARMARREGTLTTGEYGDAYIEMANKHDVLELVKFFQDKAMQNPPPKSPSSVTYSATYDIAVDPDTAEFLFSEYDPRQVPGNDGKTGRNFMASFRQMLYLKMVLSDGYVASATLGFKYPANLNITGVPVRDDFGLSGAREVYERVGQVLEQAYEVEIQYQEAKEVQAETFDIVPASDEDSALQPLINPRPFGSTIILAGAHGSGRRETARMLHHHGGYMLCPMHTTEPRKPGRIPNEDSVNHSHESFDKEVSCGEMKYWTIGSNGHKYGYTQEQLKHPKTVMYTTPQMALKMKESMPKVTIVFLDNKDSVKRHTDRLANRNGVTHEMAKATAKRKHTLRNARHKFDEVVSVEKNNFKEAAVTLINPKKTPEGRKIPKRYLKGLNSEEMAIAAKEIDKGYKYDINDPDAYEEWKSDIKAKARGYKTVPSKYKKKFIEMYGPLPEEGDFLTKIAKATGIKKSILREVEKKGLAAWRTGHRVGANQHAWARGRVYSFVTLGNTVKKGNKKMGDYKLAVKAGLIKENPPIEVMPRTNELNSTRFINLETDEDVTGKLFDGATLNAEEYPNLHVGKELNLSSKLPTGIPKKLNTAKMGNERVIVFDGGRLLAKKVNIDAPVYLETSPFKRREPSGFIVASGRLHYDEKAYTVSDTRITRWDDSVIPMLRPPYFIYDEVTIQSSPVYGPLPNPSPSKQPKASFNWLEKFTAWVELVNMKNKELIAFLDSEPWGKKAGINKAKAKQDGISRGRFSASRILIMRKKLGLTGPKDYIKAGPIIIRNYYELAQKKWTEADWEWCKKQVSFNSRARGQSGPYTDSKGRPTRKLTALWVWGHDPWRYARKIEKRKTMPKCPNVPWIGRTEKRLYGTTEYKYPEVENNPPFRRPRLYHGSSVNNLKVLKPHHNKTIGREVVFATPNYEYALAMSVPSTNDDFDIGYVNGEFMIEEQYPDAFDLLKQAAYMYEVDARGFYEHPQFPEMERIIEVTIPVKKVKRIPNVYQELRRIGANLIPYR